MALLAGAPVVPVGVLGTRELQPPDKRMPKLSGRVQVVFGKPLSFDRFAGQDRDRFVLRSSTDEILYEIMMITGQEYVDEYASRVKAERERAARLAAGDGSQPAPSGGGETPATIPPEDDASSVRVLRPDPAERRGS